MVEIKDKKRKILTYSHNDGTLNYLEKIIYLAMTCLLFSSVFLFIGCAGPELKGLQDKLVLMSDTDLLNYYHGINDRLKEMDNRSKMQERANTGEEDYFMSQNLFIAGGERYDLIKKRKLVLEELEKRNISP